MHTDSSVSQATQAIWLNAKYLPYIACIRTSDWFRISFIVFTLK